MKTKFLATVVTVMLIAFARPVFGWWYVDASSAAQHLGGASRIGPFSTYMQAEEYLKANPHFGYSIEPGGSDESSDSGSSPSVVPSIGNTLQETIINTAINAAAKPIFNAIGQSIANSIFGNDDSGQPQMDYQRQAAMAAAAAEQQRLARIAMATKLRVFWDGQDVAIQKELDGVFDVPIGHSTPFFGIGGAPNQLKPEQVTHTDSIVPDIPPAPQMDANFVGGTGIIGSSVIDFRDKQGVLAPEFLAAQQIRAEETATHHIKQSAWNCRNREAFSSQITSDDVTPKSIAMDWLKSEALNVPLYEYFHRFPGYWMANDIAGRLSDLKEFQDVLYWEEKNPMDLAFEGIRSDIEFQQSSERDDHGVAENYWTSVEHLGGQMEIRALAPVAKKFASDLVDPKEESEMDEAIRENDNAERQYDIYTGGN